MTGIPLLITYAAAVMILVELRFGGRRYPQVAGWWARAITLNAFQFGAVFLAGWAWDGWMLRHRPWSADALGDSLGGIVGYFAITFIYYWWHRARHASPFLWRWLHQLHHSPSRLEIITSFYKHPLEILINSLLSSLILYRLVGLGPQAAALATLLSGLAELVYHWNVRTPYWLGFIFQRPESHCVHHQLGHHSSNFSDLPLWDILFGSFDNPRTWSGRCGFEGDREIRLPEMLRGIDVNQAPAPAQKMVPG